MPKPQGQGLNDLYVRFYRMAERRIAERTGQGVVCFISNYSWLDGLSFPGMRQRYLDAFDIVRIDSLNGDKYRTGKLTPDGQPDPSVFSTAEDPVGIQVGTAIATLVRKGKHEGASEVEYRELWGVAKRAELLASADTEPEQLYNELNPAPQLGLPFGPAEPSQGWFNMPSLPELFPKRFHGVLTNRDAFLVSIKRRPLADRIRDYFDPALSHAEIARRYPTAMKATKRFDGHKVRDVLLARGVPDRDGLVPFTYRPFDRRWLYWESETKLLDERRPDYRQHVFRGNMWLSSAQQLRKAASEPQACLTTVGASHHLIERGSHMFPLYLRDDQFGEMIGGTRRVANLSERAFRYIEAVEAAPEDLFHHVLAILHDPAYLEANAGGLRMGWPRIPLPESASELAASAARGRLLARLLDTESDASDLLDISIAVPTKSDGSQMSDADFNVTANWGRRGQGGAVMPGGGKVVRRGDVVDVYLNEGAYWADVPWAVWEYRLGGYQVLKKWLSYREQKVLGRGSARCRRWRGFRRWPGGLGRLWTSLSS